VIRAGAHAVAVIAALYEPRRPVAENAAALLRAIGN
jgi:hypothetical protein